MTHSPPGRLRRRAWRIAAALSIAALLGGCVAYPAYPGYGSYGAPASGYYGAPAYGYPAGGYPAGGYVEFGGGWGGHDRDWHDHDRDRGGEWHR